MEIREFGEQSILKDLYFEGVKLKDYNCLGFAVGIPNWLEPASIEELLDAEEFIDAIYQEVEYYSPGRIREIGSSKDLKDNEYMIMIAFNLDDEDPLNCDFHVIRKIGDRWVDKDGRYEIAYIPSGINPEKDEWNWNDSCTNLGSDYDIVTFAVNPNMPIIHPNTKFNL